MYLKLLKHVLDLNLSSTRGPYCHLHVRALKREKARASNLATLSNYVNGLSCVPHHSIVGNTGNL